MRMVRDLDSRDRLTYLQTLAYATDDLGRLPIAEGSADQAGLYIDLNSGESRLLSEGEAIPGGVWVAQRDLNDLRPSGGVEPTPGRSGFGEGWGEQGEQVGGDRSYPEDDTGGTRRVPHGGVGEDVDPNINRPVD